MLPKTRYQGSKSKLIKEISLIIKKTLPQASSILDVFGGTGMVSLFLQQQGYSVIYNDIMKYNAWIANALLNPVRVTMDDLLKISEDIIVPTFITDTFRDIYYTEEENQHLDIMIHSIKSIEPSKQSTLFYLLCQACLIKRPYNLFHRKNIEMRMKYVERSFGNKVSWDTSFIKHMTKFMNELEKCVSPRNIRTTVLTLSYEEFKQHEDSWSLVDTVYMDPPYLKKDKPNHDYIDNYHFLEGIARYDEWHLLYDKSVPHHGFTKEAKSRYTITSIKELFETCFQTFREKNIVVSYRNDGFPTIEWIMEELGKYKTHVIRHNMKYQYALSKKDVDEVLLIGYN